jgi:outer membrane protein
MFKLYCANKNLLMKQFSLGLNIVLLAAVALLYFKVFSSTKKQASATKVSSSDSSKIREGIDDIAFVELDSLNENITFIKNRRTELERKQKAIETEWRNGMTGLQNRAAEFQRNAGSKTQQEAEKLQNQLGQEQQNIEGRKQQQTQALSEESYTFLEDIQKKLKNYISDYNKDKKYRYILTTGNGNDYMLYKDDANNITKEVTEGMNELMKVKK